MPKPHPKRRFLEDVGALHLHPERVRATVFDTHRFFDPLDKVQVKYEMLRAHEVDGRSPGGVGGFRLLARDLLHRAERLPGAWCARPHRREVGAARSAEADGRSGCMGRRSSSTRASSHRAGDSRADGRGAEHRSPSPLNRTAARGRQKKKRLTTERWTGRRAQRSSWHRSLRQAEQHNGDTSA